MIVCEARGSAERSSKIKSRAKYIQTFSGDERGRGEGEQAKGHKEKKKKEEERSWLDKMTR